MSKPMMTLTDAVSSVWEAALLAVAVRTRGHWAAHMQAVACLL